MQKDSMAKVYSKNLNAYCLKRGWISHKKAGNGSPSKLMKEAGWGSPSYWSDLLRGEKGFTLEQAVLVANALKIPLGEITGQDDHDFVDVPRIEIQVGAGPGRPAQIEEVTGHLKFTRDFLRVVGVQPGSARVVDVRGHSMEPTIKDGAVLLVSMRNKEPSENQVFVLLHPTEGPIVKRLVRVENQWLARSDNREFADIPIDDETPLTIVGRAVWMGARL